MRTRKRFLIQAFLWAPFLFSCAPSSSSIFVSSTSSSSASISSSTEPSGPFYKVTSGYNLEELGKTTQKDYLPSVGAQALLVIPVTVRGYEENATPETKNDLEKTFNGLPGETGWESVQSFYAASSYGKLALSALVTDWYDCGFTASEISAMASSANPLQGIRTILFGAASWFKETYPDDIASFDKDKDGFLDAVWLVYSAPDFTSEPTLTDETQTFWALSSGTDAQSNLASPSANNFSWASFDFMYRGYGKAKLDAHTFIHETGHLLGLDDYYDYDRKCVPMGGVDMMDRNIIDHCAYSKFALGWSSPFYADHPGTLTLRPGVESGDCVLFPTGNGWNGSAFDEYILMELYSPTGLNEADSLTPCQAVYPTSYTKLGLRIYHVDSRLCLYGDGHKKAYVDTLPLSMGSSYVCAQSNTPSRSKDSRFRLLQLLDHSGINQAVSTAVSANASLWGEGDAFSLLAYQGEFALTGRMNCGGIFRYQVAISNLSSSGVTLTISVV